MARRIILSWIGVTISKSLSSCLSRVELLELLEFLESLRSLYALTFSCRVGSEKLKSAGGLVPGSTGAGEEVADGADAGGVAAGVTRAGEIVEAAGVGADEDVTSNLLCCAIGAGDGEDAAEGEDLEEMNTI